jgi:phospholipid/cholesterol/gamma-HCH transport system substrate-binding protein
MARKASRFKVGLFVIVGLAMGLAALVYLGASSYGEGADTYVTYFNQSVQGLSRDSVVKYLGVDVGRVTDIRVAPDHNLIEVVMDIKFKGELGTNMVAQLKMAGITGLSFIELDRQQEDEDDLSPPLSFAAEHPIIPSRPSELQHIFSVVEKIAKELEQVDFKEMADHLQGTLRAANQLLSSHELAQTISNLQTASARLADMSTRLNLQIEQADIPAILAEARDAVYQGKMMLREGRRMMQAGTDMVGNGKSMLLTVEDQVVKMNLPGRAGQAGELMSKIDRQSAELMGRLIQASGRLEAVSQHLDRLVNRLERNPSDIIWGQHPEPRRIP